MKPDFLEVKIKPYDTSVMSEVEKSNTAQWATTKDWTDFQKADWNRNYGRAPEGKQYFPELIIYGEEQENIARTHSNIFALSGVDVQYLPTRSGPVIRFLHNSNLGISELDGTNYLATTLNPLISELNQGIISPLSNGDNTKLIPNIPE